MTGPPLICGTVRSSSPLASPLSPLRVRWQLPLFSMKELASPAALLTHLASLYSITPSQRFGRHFPPILRMLTCFDMPPLPTYSDTVLQNYVIPHARPHPHLAVHPRPLPSSLTASQQYPTTLFSDHPDEEP